MDSCTSYQHAVKSPEGHFHRIDALFSDILQFYPLVYEPDLSILQGLVPKSTHRLTRPLGETLLTDELFRETLVEGVCQLLSRLPIIPVKSHVFLGPHVFASIPASCFHLDPLRAPAIVSGECLPPPSQEDNVSNSEVVLEQCKKSQPVDKSPEVPRKVWMLNRIRASHSPFRKPVVPGTLRSWDRLQVVTQVSTHVIRLALQIILLGNKNYSDPFRDYVDTIAELLEGATKQLQVANGTKEEGSWLIVQAFLWTSWQRSMMLYYWYQSYGQLRLGVYYHGNREMVLRAVPSRSFEQRNEHKAYSSQSRSEKVRYMCNWAYRLLWRDRASVGQDFRRFHEVYRELFGDRPARCIINDSINECTGTAPESRQRFTGARIVDQSAHDVSCLRSMCTPLFWDEQSYRSVQGARAVCLDGTDDKLLRYLFWGDACNISCLEPRPGR